MKTHEKVKTQAKTMTVRNDISKKALYPPTVNH